MTLILGKLTEPAQNITRLNSEPAQNVTRLNIYLFDI